MKVVYHKNFLRDLKQITDNQILTSTKKFLLELEWTNSLHEIQNIKKLSGYRYFYRKRIGDFRIGFRFQDETVTIERMLHRKTIYKEYP